MTLESAVKGRAGRKVFALLGNILQHTRKIQKEILPPLNFYQKSAQ